MNKITKCGISEATDFHSLWNLPKLPLTEQMGNFNPESLNYDQELVISIPTGHVQLKNQLSPEVLYTESDYSYRTSSAFSAERGVIFFENVLKGVAENKKFESIVDVGGNDLSLMRRLSSYGKNRTVIDPVCKTIDGKTIDGIKVFGRFIEEVNLSSDIKKPDLVICRHTMEHISRPKDVIEQWFKQCSDNCKYIIEIPCFENLAESLRFDAIFHQHYHLFDLDSLKYLIWECGGEYLSHTHYHQGSCGGSLIIAFKKAKSKQTKPEMSNLDEKIKYYERRINLFKNQMQVYSQLLKDLPRPIYGYGAGLMLATLGYHLKTDFTSFECILDDDLEKNDTGYKNIPVKIKTPSLENPPENASYLITSMENLRPIYKRILELNPRRIISPLIS